MDGKNIIVPRLNIKRQQATSYLIYDLFINDFVHKDNKNCYMA